MMLTLYALDEKESTTTLPIVACYRLILNLMCHVAKAELLGYLFYLEEKNNKCGIRI